MHVVKFYLKLQKLRFLRKIDRLQIPLILALILLIGGFTALSSALFMTIKNFQYIYAGLALYNPLSLSNSKHAYFLRTTYTKKDYHRIRITENLLLLSPFVIMLFIAGSALLSLGALIVCLASIYFDPVKFEAKPIPTPFYKHPFEFIIGFRLSFYLIFFGYYLSYTAYRYSNFYLSIFVILALSILSLFYYLKIEEPYFVWVFKLTPNKFLLYKLKEAVLSYFGLALIPTLTSILIDSNGLHLIGLALFLGISIVLTAVVSKYSAFPDEPSLKEGMLLLFTVLFPGFSIIAFPYFYYRAKKQLKGILL